MVDVLHLRGFEPSVHELSNALDRELRSRSQERSLRLDIANRAWSARGVHLLPEYVDTVARDYGAVLAQLDIARDAEKARAAVNQWVSRSTEGKIDELFPEGKITAHTRLILVNALYLKARWQFPFPPEATSQQPFRLADGSEVQVPTMHYDEYLPSGAGRGGRRCGCRTRASASL